MELHKSGGTRAHVIGDSLSNRNNSLNFLRLVLASTVLLSHAAGLANFQQWVGLVNGTSAAQVALYAFFALSGYLIAQSAMRSAPDRFVWKRVLRIFPGLIICLIVTAFVFGIIYWYHEGPHPCGLSCYFTAPDSPVGYVLKNSLLANPFLVQHTIAGTPSSYFVPAWNASIWTLFYEFACYLVVLALGMIGLLRRRVWTLVGTLGLWLVVIIITVTPSLAVHFNEFRYISIGAMLRFSLVFLAASVIYLYREVIPDSGWIALASSAIYAIGIAAPITTVGKLPTLEFTPLDLAAPFIAYPILWLAIHLPFRRIGAKNDYSYGIYIYGWPVTQLIIMWNLNRFGVISFELFALGATLPFAIASWWLIERPSLRLKESRPRPKETDLPPGEGRQGAGRIRHSR